MTEKVCQDSNCRARLTRWDKRAKSNVQELAKILKTAMSQALWWMTKMYLTRLNAPKYRNRWSINLNATNSFNNNNKLRMLNKANIWLKLRLAQMDIRHSWILLVHFVIFQIRLIIMFMVKGTAGSRIKMVVCLFQHRFTDAFLSV